MQKKQAIAIGFMVIISVLILVSFNHFKGEDFETIEVSKTGYDGEIKLELLFSEEKLEGINVIEQSETPGIGDNAINSTIEKILEANSPNVDTMSGATMSSKAVIEAVVEGLEEMDFDFEYPEFLKEADYSPKGELITTKGYNGDITLDIIITDGVIEDIILVSENETPGIGDNAINSTIEKILEANSPDVDTMSGATMSSKAVIEAVKEALE